MKKLTEAVKNYLKQLISPTEKETEYLERFLAEDYRPEQEVAGAGRSQIPIFHGV